MKDAILLGDSAYTVVLDMAYEPWETTKRSKYVYQTVEESIIAQCMDGYILYMAACL